MLFHTLMLIVTSASHLSPGRGKGLSSVNITSPVGINLSYHVITAGAAWPPWSKTVALLLIHDALFAGVTLTLSTSVIWEKKKKTYGQCLEPLCSLGTRPLFRFHCTCWASAGGWPSEFHAEAQECSSWDTSRRSWGPPRGPGWPDGCVLCLRPKGSAFRSFFRSGQNKNRTLASVVLVLTNALTFILLFQNVQRCASLWNVVIHLWQNLLLLVLIIVGAHWTHGKLEMNWLTHLSQWWTASDGQDTKGWRQFSFTNYHKGISHSGRHGNYHNVEPFWVECPSSILGLCVRFYASFSRYRHQT